MDRQDRALLRVVLEEVEQDFKDDRVFQDLVRALEDRVNYHRRAFQKTNRWFSRMRTSFRIGIPVGTGLLTALPGLDFFGTRPGYVTVAGTLLTALAVVNSVLRPSETWVSTTHLLIGLHDWEMDLIVKLRQVTSLDAAYKLLAEKDAELSRVGAQWTAILQPTSGGEPIRDDGVDHLGRGGGAGAAASSTTRAASLGAKAPIASKR